MKTQIIKAEVSANKTSDGTTQGRSPKLNTKSFYIRATAALATVFVLSVQLVFAQNPSASMSASGRPAEGNYWRGLITRSASTGFFTTRFPGVLIKSGVTNTNNSDNFFKERFNIAKHARFGLLGDVAAATTIPFFIPARNGRLKACLSFKRDGVAIQPKGPANFHYVAIDLKIKF